ncbi:hypothetical protein IEQ34_001806 [Dendrobium chrysotoxum]|uniref:AIPP2-like SPOC-like domain-containing protein n=1 Tax=Dendrobium chrysotoxum TaxID=161865 RepID=A0AAV7HQ81_DENCH|nr:hypothetical protein IEQ34_001806 [Dendrobium chrysotoxum]
MALGSDGEYGELLESLGAAEVWDLGKKMDKMRVNVCWQCGDVGLSEAFLYCIVCKSAGRHSYCLEEIPEDLTAEIDWLCEDCRSKSPNSVSKAKFPTPASLGILDHGSVRAQIGLNSPCQEIGSANDHLVSFQDQHTVSNVRIGSSVKQDNHISYDYERNTLSCAIGGASGTIISSAHFKQNDDDIEEFDNEKSKRERPMLSDKDALDDSQLLVEAQGTNIQFAVKRLLNNSVEESNLHLIGGSCELGAGRSSVCFGLKEDETVESDKESSKRRELILPDKDELNSFHHLIDGEGTNFSLASKGSPGASVEPSDSNVIIGRGARCTTHNFCSVGSSACCKQEDDKIEEYKKGKSESRGMILPTNNFHRLIDGQGSSISFIEKRLPGTSVERSDRHTIGRTLSNDGNELDAVRSSAYFTVKEDEIEEYRKGNSKGRLIVPYNYRLDNFDPAIDGQGTKFSFTVEHDVCTSIEPSDKTSKRISSCGTNALDAVVSATCSEFKEGQIEEQKEKPVIRMIVPGMDQLDDIQPFTDGQDSSIKFATTSLSVTSIRTSDKQTIVSTSSCDIGALGVVRSSACFGLKEGEIKAQSKKKRKRRRPRKRRLIPPVKGGRDNFQPVIFSQGNNIPVVAERILGSPIMASDKQIIGRINTSDTLGAMKSSVCFELKKGKIDGYGKEKSESRSLILPTEHELNSLHSVIDRGDTSNFAAKRLPDTSVKPSDRHAKKWIDTKAQINIPCQLTSPSLSFISPVWRGCFNINKAELGPLRAHLSSRACLKVCNCARKLPLVLHMQKLPRLVAWPNSFKVSSPTVDSIALYFFPESDRAETVLDELVDDFINKDLMLRFEFDEVELLIFSSFMLPREHQMFSGKYYAWGVFKPRSAKICSLPADSHTAYQVGEALKPMRRSEMEDHDVGLFKDSAQEINDFTLRRSLVRPGEGTVRVLADSSDACEEGKLKTLCRKSSMHVELLWHKEERLGDCDKKCDLKMSKNYTLELKEVAEERKES